MHVQKSVANRIAVMVASISANSGMSRYNVRYPQTLTERAFLLVRSRSTRAFSLLCCGSGSHFDDYGACNTESFKESRQVHVGDLVGIPPDPSK